MTGITIILTAILLTIPVLCYELERIAKALEEIKRVAGAGTHKGGTP